MILLNSNTIESVHSTIEIFDSMACYFNLYSINAPLKLAKILFLTYSNISFASFQASQSAVGNSSPGNAAASVQEFSIRVPK